jgi:uncharacterized membrane protein
MDILGRLFVKRDNAMLLLIQAKYRLYHVQKARVNQLYDNYTKKIKLKNNNLIYKYLTVLHKKQK